MRDVSQYNVTVDTVAPCADPSSAAASAHPLHANLERGLTMTHVPRTKKRVYGPRDSLEMSFVEDYISPPPPPSNSADVLKRTSLGLTPGLGRSTSELGASNDSAGTEKTAASSTTCASDSKSLDRFGLARPRISVDTVSTSEHSLTIDCITCEEPSAANVDDAHDDDDTRNKQERALTESIMKYKTHEESIKYSYESSRRKHLKKRKQKKKKKRASIKRNRLSGTALARMGRRVGSLPDMKRALGSVVRLGSTANVNSDSPGKASEGSTSTKTMPRGGETNAYWASPPVPAATATEASAGNIFLDMLEKKEARDTEKDQECGANSTPTMSCSDGAISAAVVPSVTPSTSGST